MLGYLTTGILVGPAVLDWLPYEHGIRLFAELGAVLLMLNIGLEFSLPRLLSAKRLILGLGGAQMIVTTILFSLLVGWWGLTPIESFIIGSALAMSSTVVVFNQLDAQLETPAPHGRVAMGILLFQSIATVLLLGTLPILADEPIWFAWELSLAIGKTMLLFLILVSLGRGLLTPFLHWVSEKKSLELNMLTALFVLFFAFSMSSLAGLSVTLSGFMAGMLLGVTLIRHQVKTDIRPFRTLMIGLFFTSIGMQLEPAIIIQKPVLIFLILIALIGAKLVIIGLLIRFFGQPTMDSWRSAILLAQGGEFGLILIASALALDALDPSRAQPILVAIVMSMAVAPFMLRFKNQLAAFLTTGRYSSDTHDVEAIIAETGSDYNAHVIICGYGRMGQNLANLLSQENIPVLALDLDPERIRQAVAAGESALFGNVLQPGILRAAGIDRAKALAITFDNATLVERIVRHVRSLHSDIPILARSTLARNDNNLVQAGATVFPEGLETSIAFAGRLLTMLGISPSRVEARINMIRAENYAPLRTFFHDSSELATSNDAQDYPLKARVIIILESYYASGRTLQELGLADLGIKQIDLIRGKNQVPSHLLVTPFQPGDVLLIIGHRDKLNRAIARIIEGA